ncbi:hypothetical protein PCURB6_15510 [Paenibacillus curdlanolyticus]|nr:hypothetical protein PCURB6_15510 [Paenibacillus curdlanolyticus]
MLLTAQDIVYILLDFRQYSSKSTENYTHVINFRQNSQYALFISTKIENRYSIVHNCGTA